MVDMDRMEYTLAQAALLEEDIVVTDTWLVKSNRFRGTRMIRSNGGA